MKKRAFLIFLLSLVLIFPVFAVSAETIWYASSEMLKNMAENRGIAQDGTDEEIRKRLYEYYGYEEASVTINSPGSNDGEDNYNLTIRNADSVSSSGGVVTLEGNVSIDFDFSGSAKKTLSASTVLVDSSRSILTAIGSASYTDTAKDAAIRDISADILTVRWDSMDILLTGGSTSTERENSEKKKVTFSTTGERLSYLNEGAVVFDEGYITSNPETAYSSISASSILILPGQDMFLSSATFNIGRVPIFYLPFFFFPGSRILGNPSFGFSSDKGAFVNTTFEIFGSYPKIQNTDESSSFSSLLKSTESAGEENVTGYYYSEKEEKNGLEKFATSTSSYLVVMADAYKGGSSATLLRNGGVHLGVDSLLNLYDKKFRVAFSASVTTPISSKSRKLRYFGNASLSFSSWGLSAEASVPFYSDSTVLYHYGNRLTGFSYGPLLGGKSTFPTDYSSSGITSYTRKLRLSYTLPSSVKVPFISSFSIKNVSLEGNYTLSGPTTLSSSSSSVPSSYSLPSVSVALSGTIFSTESRKKAAESSEKTEKKEEDNAEKNEEKDILLPSPYEKAITSSSSSSAETYKASKFSLSYSVTEDFSNKINNNTSTGTRHDGKMTNTFYSRLTAEGNIGDIITVSDVFTNSLSYTDTSDYASASWTRKLVSTPLNTLKLSVPYAGLTYNLSFRPFDYSNETKSSGDISTATSGLEFTKDSIKTHSIEFGKSFSSSFLGTFSADISYILPPLDGKITPTLRWSGWGLSSSLSWIIKEGDEGYRSDKVTLNLGYTSSYVVFSSVSYYQTQNYDVNDFWKPLTVTGTLRVKTRDSKYYIEGKVNGDGSVDGFITTCSATLKADEVSAVLSFKNQDGAVSFDSVNLKTTLSTRSFQLWKGRIYMAFALDSTLFLSHSDKSRSYFTLGPSITLSVAEFMDIKLSFTSQNSKLGSYYSDGKFSFSSMWDDLMRSVDFFGKGRYNTNFVIQNAVIDFVHYMTDWNLNFSYSTSFQKSTTGGKTVYTLQPSFSVYLAWNTMPDLKVQENWTKDSSGNWTRK